MMTLISKIETHGCGCDAQVLSKRLISIDGAMKEIQSRAVPVSETETLPLAKAFGRILADPVTSAEMRPAFDNSAMDGYAVDTRDLDGTGPWLLTVTDRVVAGTSSSRPLGDLQAMRIFTGAPIPAKANAVVMQEEVNRNGSVIRLNHRPASGLNIRKAGSERKPGEVILEAGRSLAAPELAACAAVDIGEVKVRRAIRVGVLVTGDEVEKAGSGRTGAQIPDVNSPMLASILLRPSVKLVALDHAEDSLEKLQNQLEKMARSVDLIITTGGISVGEEDHVKPALKAMGTEIFFSGVAVKPGKPVSFGSVGSTLWLGLPGNPLSAFVTWQLFGEALLDALQGARSAVSPRRNVVTGRSLRHKLGRCELRPARIIGTDSLGRDVVKFEEATYSDRISHLPDADGVILIPAEFDHLPAGALVEFQPFKLA